MDSIVQSIAAELGRRPEHVENVIRLLDEGNTIPFIARYRKELHGTMDDTALRTLAERLAYLRNLQSRQEDVCRLIDAQGKLTAQLADAIRSATTLAELEDLYRPYRQKRRTRAGIARERGLEPLAEILFAQARDMAPPAQLAEGFVAPEKDLPDAASVLAGASDILAEWISDSATVRKKLRAFLLREGRIASRQAAEGDSVYRLYYAFTCPLSSLRGYQVLALDRGEKEKLLKVAVTADRDKAVSLVCREVVRPGSPAMAFVRTAAEDAYDRLLQPSMEREIRNILTEEAAAGAIRMFALNLKPLLLQPPVKGKITLGLDPAYRTGCKLAVVDRTGRVLDTAVIYPTPPHNKTEEARGVLKSLICTYGVEVIAIGNGTASGESERFVAALLPELERPVSYAVVNEAGASVYSASKLGAEEFPEYDVSLRSAVSIARRLQDPLAELVKIDPKSIGVGQYQHDMPQARLGEALDGVVEDCVNAVGVDLNTASPALLSRVSGLNGTVAGNIVAYREENGAFSARREMLNVPKLGQKTYQQCAGFLRIPESENLLDNTGVHPESYTAAEKLLTICGYTMADAACGNVKELSARITELGEARCAEFAGVGVPTLWDVAKELEKPGRDIRDELPPPILRTDVMDISDLRPGMRLWGTVRNVIDFGAFVDIGVHQDGLVHLSQLCDRFVRHPSEVVSVGDVVEVTVLSVDVDKKRIALSMKRV